MSVLFRCAGVQHPLVNQVHSLLKNRYPDEGRIAVSGAQAHHVIIANRVHLDVLIYCPQLDTGKQLTTLVEELSGLAEASLQVSEKTMRRLDSSRSPTPVVSACRIFRADITNFRSRNRSLVVVLDGIRMVGNAGCLIRSANAACADLVAFTNRVFRLSNPQLVSASCGTILGTTFLDCPVDELGLFFRDKGYSIYLADANYGAPYDEVRYPERVALILGSEHSGICEEWYRIAHARVTVPMGGCVDSLNVAAAGSILMFAASRRMGLVGIAE